jgi:hypothetical protein
VKQLTDALSPWRQTVRRVDEIVVARGLVAVWGRSREPQQVVLTALSGVRPLSTYSYENYLYVLKSGSVRGWPPQPRKALTVALRGGC